MATPTIGTVSAVRTGSAVSTDNVAFTMVAGRAYVVLWAKTAGAGTRSFTASDDLGNTYGNYVETATTAAIRSAAHTTICTTGGSATITVTVSGGTTTFSWQVIEIIPTSGTLGFGASSTFEDGSATTSHQNAASSGFSPSADSAIVGLGGGTTGSAFGTATAGGSYTLQSGSSNVFASETRTTGSLLTNEQVPWTSSTARQCKGCAVYITETGGGGGGGGGPIFGGRALGRGRILGGSALC